MRKEFQTEDGRLHQFIECPVCKSVLEERFFRECPNGKDGNEYYCSVCGYYLISRELIAVLSGDKYKNKHHIISGVIANATRRNITWENEINDIYFFTPDETKPPIVLHTGNIDDLIYGAKIPKTPIDMMKEWILLMYEFSSEAQFARFLDTDTAYPLVYAHSKDEFEHLMKWLADDGLIEFEKNKPYSMRLTKNGWLKADEWNKVSINSNQAFVATWFDNKMDLAYFDGIKPALEEMGYEVIRMKELDHNGNIDHRIIAEMRRSGLVIADLTGARQSVYYEAGFAHGLEIPLILTCRKRSKVHFDLDHYNMIKWNNLDELKQKLIDRIGATIPGRAQLQKIK